MEIDAQNRLVSLSVGEFARFSPYAQRSDSMGFGNWRAAAGQQWHQEIQRQAPDKGFDNERPIKGDILWRGWTLQLTGRIDQIRSSPDRICLREIKTVTTELPIDSNTLVARYRSYCIQLLAYRELLSRESSTSTVPIELDLYLVELSTGVAQSVRLDSGHDSLVVDQFDLLADYLDQKRERLDRLASLRFKPAYESPRPGQETIQKDLADGFQKSPIVCLEAPTGYGKTGVAWEFALNRLASGQADRIVYLTSKSTGQLEAAQRLDALLEAQSSATYWQIRNKGEHCVNHEFRCSPKTCQYIANLEEKWGQSRLEPLFLASSKPISIDELKASSAAAGICPYETMRTALGYRDIWIGDYNYLFASNSGRLLFDQPDFDPSKTFLIIDEAHNLPSRIESNLSTELDSLSLSGLVNELAEIGAGRNIQKAVANLTDECLAYAKGDILSLRQIDDLAELLLSLLSRISNEPLPYESIGPESLDTLWNLSSGAAALKENADRYIAWATESGRIKIACIDPSPEILETLSLFKETLMLSATLHPIDGFWEQCGIADHIPAPSHVTPPAPWLEGAYDIAIDTRADTRLKMRESGSDVTAKTIATLADTFSPIIVFFPSYAYAEQIRDALSQAYPFYRIAMQTRGKGETLADRTAFIDDAIRFHEIVFLTLGSSFAEGIDLIGGKIKAAIVVSPALPEVNPVQQSKRDYFDGRHGNGFERAYLQPGIQKVNQALGRLVRAPYQKVKVLLHCQRFADKGTIALLAEHYRKGRYIFSDDDLSKWIEHAYQ